MTLTAIAAGREMSFYIDSCVEVVAHWNGNVINQATDHLAIIY